MVPVPAVAHAGAQTAHHLIHGVRQRSLVRHAAFHAFGHQLLVRLPGSSGRWSRGPCAMAPRLPMPRYTLKLAALDRFPSRRGFPRSTGEQAADHDRVRARRDAPWRMSPEYLMPPSAMMVTPVPSAASAQSAISRQLRHADAGHDPGGADAARADTDLDAHSRPLRSGHG